jgi:phosphoglycerate dehydrogenase-like enzyme
VTPHLGGATKEVVLNHSLMIEEDVMAFLEGRRPGRMVNPEVWRA